MGGAHCFFPHKYPRALNFSLFPLLVQACMINLPPLLPFFITNSISDLFTLAEVPAAYIQHINFQISIQRHTSRWGRLQSPACQLLHLFLIYLPSSYPCDLLLLTPSFSSTVKRRLISTSSLSATSIPASRPPLVSLVLTIFERLAKKRRSFDLQVRWYRQAYD